MFIKQKINQSGLSTLLVVLILALLLEIAFFSVFLLARLGVQRSVTGQYSRKAYYAAEGALHDTLQLLQTYDTWPPVSPFSQDMIVGGTPVKRTIVYDSATQTYQIDIGGDYQDAKRRFIAEYQLGTTATTRQPLDIMLVVDRSSSMGPILDAVKQSLINMVDTLELEPGDRIGVVTYSNAARIDQPLTTDFNLVKTAISNIVLLGRTNISYGMIRAAEQLDLPDAEPNRKNIVVFFTDGVANVYMLPGNVQFICSRQVLDYVNQPNPPYAPDNGGTECTNEAVVVANNQIAAGYELFGVFYKPPFTEAELELGSKTLQEMMQDPERIFETDVVEELDNIFDQIAGEVSDLKNASFSYEEVEPIPD